MTEPSVDLVATVGPLDPVVALLRELLHVASANRALAVIERPGGDFGDDEPAVVDVERLSPIEVTVGERVYHLPHSIDLDLDVPVATLPAFKPLPPFDADPETGDIAAPLGGVERYAIDTRAAAALLGGANVLQLHWDTARPRVSFSVTARADDSEPLVLGIGEESFPMPPGWPESQTLAGGSTATEPDVG
ncbi:MAG: hypothetical protein ITG02_06035 [Patulibacter sp.]|nr:hypothetical protein [Patulibacter sp.]